MHTGTCSIYILYARCVLTLSHLVSSVTISTDIQLLRDMWSTDYPYYDMDV